MYDMERALEIGGHQMAVYLQDKAESMTGTELNAEDDYIPEFKETVRVMNILNRPVGFVCKSSAGRVVRLVQPYDSTIFTSEPEELSSQWGFAWSTDPAKALPFIALSTSPYNTGDCCTYKGSVWRSTGDYNVTKPDAVGALWEKIIQ